MLSDVIKKWGGEEVSPMDVYTDVFKLGDGLIQRDGEAPGAFKANPIGYWKNDNDERGHFRIMFEDTFEDVLHELQMADFALLNAVTYFGRRRDMNHSSKMYAMIFDLDGVNDSKLNNFFNAAFVSDFYPIPNYMCLSGHGVHLYYVFEEPVSLFPYIKVQLKTLKQSLTERMWNPYTSDYADRGLDIEQQGIYQAFRPIGGKTKKDAPEKVVRAFQINNHPYSLRQLNRYVPEESRLNEKNLFRESKMTLEQAKLKYPKWYEKVVVNKDTTPVKWDIRGKVHGSNPQALYDWWKRKIKEGATWKHRYFAIMCLVIYGVKCDVPYDEVKADAMELVPFLNSINPDDPFTDKDVMSALECYDDRYCTFPRADIMKISKIVIPENTRNGQKQADHLEEARAVRDIRQKRKGTKWTDNNGRPVGSGTKEKLVKTYIKEHPNQNVTEISRAINVSRTTVYKYQKEMNDEKKKRAAASDYVVTLPDGTEMIIETHNSDMDEYDRMRMERLRKYQELSNRETELNE